MQTQEHLVEVSAELERKLEQLRLAWRMPSTTAVIERLISAQLDRAVYGMTGIRPGPRLVVDNHRPNPDDKPAPGHEGPP